MPKVNVLEKEPISLAELKAEMTKISERDEELNYRAGKTNEYANEFTELTVEEYEDLKEQIEALEIPRLKDVHIIKLADFLPTEEDEVNVILQGYPLTLSKENISKLVEVIDDFA